MRSARIGAVLVAAALAACGVKAPPRPPERKAAPGTTPDPSTSTTTQSSTPTKP